MPYIAKINDALTSRNESNILPVSNLKIRVDKNITKSDVDVIS